MRAIGALVRIYKEKKPNLERRRALVLQGAKMDDPSYKTEAIEFIKQGFYEWEPSDHFLWLNCFPKEKIEEKENFEMEIQNVQVEEDSLVQKQILLLLLISKYRTFLETSNVNLSVLVKGIVMTVIKFLCQVSTVNKVKED